MKRASKHQFQKITLAPLGGGINIALPPEQIADNEMQECENFIFERDSARLVGRGGLRSLITFESRVKSMFYDIETNTTFVFLENRDCYQLTISSGNVQKRYLDKVTGYEVPQCCKFNNNLFVASGGLLQYFDYQEQASETGAKIYSLNTITSSPICDRLFYRWGRLAVAKRGSDRITYSYVGDAKSDTAWTENMNDDASSKWLDVGNYDGGDIAEIVPLATDMIVFKTNGAVYQLVGDADFNTWAVYNVSNFSDLTTDFMAGISATNIGNEVVFLSLRGLKTLSTTQDYGNISATDIGSKFNKLLTTNMYEPEMYHLRRYMTILIRPKADKDYFVAYNYGLNAATILKFGFSIEYILETKDDLFVGANNTVYQWTEEATMDDDLPINYKLVPKDTIGSDKLLVKAIDTKFSSDHAGDTLLTIGERLKVTMPCNDRKKIRCNHSEETIHLEVSSQSRFEVDHIILDVAAL